MSNKVRAHDKFRRGRLAHSQCHRTNYQDDYRPSKYSMVTTDCKYLSLYTYTTLETEISQASSKVNQ